jgi:LmbE family N-acetylglucosaminyl deacetylase
MAERLAPEHVPLRTDFRPERPRGRRRRRARRITGAVLAAAVLLVGTVFTLHFLSIHRSASEIRATGLIPAEMPADVLVVLARPGQEVAMAGTLAALDEAGVQVHVLSLTSGETQAPRIDEGEDRIGGIRADELATSGDVLGVESVTVGDHPDGGLLAADPAAVAASIEAAIEDVRPSVILTVADLTGEDGDSQAVASYAMNAAGAEDSGVGRVWTVTRGDREVSWNAAVADPIAGDDRPEPQVAIRIEDQAAEKGQALRAHGTQSPDLVQATYPYADRVPAWAYFRFWDREYFTLLWGEPLQ